MTLIDTKPDEGLAAAEEASHPNEVPVPAPPRGLGGFVGTADHKVVGRLYLLCSLVFLGGALVLAALVGADGIDLSRLDVLDGNTYFQVFTLSQVGLVFLGVLPALLGLAIYIVPLQVGASTVAFPRAATASFWGWLVGSGLLIGGYAINGGPAGGKLEGVLLAYAAWGVILLSLAAAAVCVVTTVVALRAEGMSLARVPATSWSMLVAGSVWLLTLPVLAANLIVIYLDTDHGQVLFGLPAKAWPQLRWAFVQPAVFALAIPVLGIAADIVAVVARRRVAAHGATLVAIGAFGALSFGPWAQTAFNPRLVGQAVYVLMSFAIILPCLALLGGLADTLRRGKPQATAALPLALLSVVALLAAAVSAAANALAPLHLRTTMWGEGVAKLVIGAVVLSLAAALHYWGPKMWGRSPLEPVSGLALLVLLAGTAAFGGGELIAGGVGQLPLWPSGVADEIASGAELGLTISAIGAALLVVGIALVILAQLPAATGKGRAAGADPWGGHTLEWATSSPPPYQNFDAVVADVTSPCPLLDARESAQEVK